MTRMITLARHATAATVHTGMSEAGLKDFDRPLTQEGVIEAEKMGLTLSNDGRNAISLILSSPALRAITTAKIYADALHVHHEQIVVEPRVYEASYATLLSVLNGQNDQTQHALLVGHNPGISDLAAALAPSRFYSLPPAASVTLAFDTDSWRELEEGSGELLAYQLPGR